MLQRQNITIPLGEGIDTKVDPKLVQSKSLVLENAIFKHIGGIEKRYGLNSASTNVLGGGNITSGKAIAVYNDELLLVSNDKLYSYADQNDLWVEKSKLSAIAANSTTLIKNESQQTIPDCAYGNGITVYAWEDSSGGVKASVIDQQTGNPILSNIQLSLTGVNPKCSYNTNYLFVWYIETNTLKLSKVDIQNPTAFQAAEVVTADFNATPIYDISKAGNNFIMAYHTNASKLKIAYMNSNGHIAGPLDGLAAPVVYNDTADAISTCVYFVGDLINDGVYVLYHNVTNGMIALVYDLTLNSNTVTTLDPITTAVTNITCISTSASQVQAFYEVSAAQTYNHYIKSNIINRDGTTTTASVLIRSLGLISKAFLGPDNNIYLIAAHDSPLQPVYFTLQILSASEVFLVNRIDYQNSGGLTAKANSLTNAPQIDSLRFVFPLSVKIQLRSESGDVYTQKGLQSTILNFDNTQLYSTAVLGGSLYIAGGMLFAYDGSNVVESGYNLYPENITSSITPSGGNIATGTYEYSVVWEWYDLAGQVHRSAPSIPLSVTITVNSSTVTLTIPTLRITERRGSRGNVSIAVYRTEANQTVFYRVSSISSPLINDSTIDSVTFVDTLADSSIISNELIYTTGGVLENIAPPSVVNISTYGNRLVISGLEDANEIWLSKLYTAGEAVGFSDLITTRIDEGLRGIKSQSVMDEKMIFFKDNAAFVLVAQGPDNTGLNDDIRIPQIISTDVGCPFSRSVVLTPNGIMFKSLKGYYLLDRNLTASYIGDKVEQFNNLTVSGSELIDKFNEIRFVHSNGDALIYNYYKQDWCTFTNYTAIACKEWKETFVLLRSNGTLDKEVIGSYMDNGSSYSMKVITPWIKFAGLQGFQRVYQAIMLGEYKSKHLLSVRVGYNFEAGWRESFVMDSALVLGDNYYGEDAYYGLGEYGGVIDEIYQFKVNPMIQKCQSIRFEIMDYNPDLIDGAAFSIVALTLDCGMKASVFKVPVSKNLGA